jgi:antitoxin component of RelBE/YafQ-DinJ toxin-antitoxin module
MTNQEIDRLANEVLRETGLPLKLFSLDHVQNKARVWALSFSDRNNTSHQVQIDLSDHKTDDAVKAEIKRQLE